MDVHAHLADPSFSGKEDELLEQAFASGVAAVVAVAEGADDCDTLAKMAAARFASASAAGAPPSCGLGVCLGLHPVQVGLDGAWRSAEAADVGPVLARLRAHASAPWLVGVGEVGLDFCPRTLSSRPGLTAEQVKEEQRQVLREQVRAARRLGLPLNVHSRSAGHHAVTLLAEEGAGLGATAPAPGTHGDATGRELLRAGAAASEADADDAAADGGEADSGGAGSAGLGTGAAGSRTGSGGPGAVLHAFDGRARFVREGVERGFFFSVPPSAARSPVVRKWLPHCPLDRLLLETDSPALPEVKGAVNTPACAAASLRLVAEALGRTEEEVAAATTANALRLMPRLAALMPPAV